MALGDLLEGPDEIEVDGLLIGPDRSDIIGQSLTGLATPSIRSETQDADGDGGYVGRSRFGVREIRGRFKVIGRDKLADLRAVMMRRDFATPWVFRGFGYGDEPQVIYARPVADPMAVEANTTSNSAEVWDVELAWQAVDPVVYSLTTTEEACSIADGSMTVVNDGNFASRSSFAYELDFVAGGGGCVNPWICNADHPGETVRFLYSFPASSHLTVAAEGPARVRMPRIGGVVSKSKVRGPNGSPAPGWPVLYPGDNTIEVGCDSGGGVWTITARSTSV